MKEEAIISDLFRAEQLGLMPVFEKSAANFGVPKQILLAVASRESRMGDALGDDLSNQFRGDNNNGHGIMQIDRRWHPDFTSTHAPNDHQANINKSAEILAQNFDVYQNWKYALAAYNAGRGNVNKAIRQDKDPDAFTTGGDYGSDVLERAKIIEKHVDPVSSRIGVVLILFAAGYLILNHTSL